MEEKQQRSRNRIVLVPAPFQGHINPMLQLGTFLHSGGFSITVVHTQLNSPNPSNHPKFRFQAIPDCLPQDIVWTKGLIGTINLITENCRAVFEEWLFRVMKDQDDDEIICVIYDELMYFAEAVANQFKLQSIILSTTSAATVISRVALIQLKAEGYIPFQDSASQDLVPTLHPLRFKDLPLLIFGALEDFLELIRNMYNIRTSSAIIWNTVDCLEETSLRQLQQQSQVAIFRIGPLHRLSPNSSGSILKEDKSCIEWLNNQAHSSVIYVSLGSLAFMDAKELVEMAWGLVNSKQPFLWVVRPSNDSEKLESLLPEGFMEAVNANGHVVKWAPQKEVLAHSAVGGFWSHCGWNSTLESIYEGVPMICQPCFGDQKVNSRHVSYVWRIGLEFENDFKRGEIEKTLRRLMVDKEGEVIRQRAKNLKENLELCIKEGGSSYNSCHELLDFISSFQLQSQQLV